MQKCSNCKKLYSELQLFKIDLNICRRKYKKNLYSMDKDEIKNNDVLCIKCYYIGQSKIFESLTRSVADCIGSDQINETSTR